MASDWYNAYMRRLREVSAGKSAPTPGGGTSARSAQEIAASLIASNRTAPAPPPPPSRGFLNTGFDFNLKDFFKIGSEGAANTLKLGGAALDLISRGNYAVANPFTQAAKEKKLPTFLKPIEAASEALMGRELFETRDNLGEDVGDFFKGLTGREKNTFGDALREGGVGQMGRIPFTPITGRGALGFGLDVALDPLSWVPGVAFAKAGKAVGKGAKKVVPGLSKPAVSGKTHELTETVPASSFIDAVTKDSSKLTSDQLKALPAPTGSPAFRSLEAGPSAPTGLRGLPEGQSTIRSRQYAAATPDQWQPQAMDFGESLVGDAMSVLNRTLSNVPMKRNLSKIKAPMEDGVQIGTRPIMGEKVTEIPITEGGVNPREYLAGRFTTRYLKNKAVSDDTFKFIAPAAYNGPVTTSKGKRLATIRDLQKWVHAAPNAAEKAKRVTHFNSALSASGQANARAMGKKGLERGIPITSVTAGGKRVRSEITINEIIDDVLGDPLDLPRNLRITSSSAGGPGQEMNYADWIARKRQQVESLPKGKTTIEKKIEQIVVKEEPILDRRPTRDPLKRMMWQMELENAGLSPQEVAKANRLLNLKGGEAKVANYLKILEAQYSGRSVTLDEFAKAIKTGAIDEQSDMVQNLYRTFGVSDTTQLKRAVTRISKRGETKFAKVDGLDQGVLDIDIPRTKKSKKHQEYDSPWNQARISAEVQAKADEVLLEADEAKQIGLDVFEDAKVRLGQPEITSITNVIEGLGSAQMKEVTKDGLWNTTTLRGAHRTDKTPGKGFAKWPGATRNFQYTASRHIKNELSKNYPNWWNLAPTERAEIYIRTQKAFDDTIRSRNINPVTSAGLKGHPLSIGDITDALGPEWVGKFFVDNRTGVPPTNLIAAVEDVMDHLSAGGSAEDLVDNLLQWGKRPITKHAGTGKTVETIESNFWKTAAKNNDKFVHENFVKPMIDAAPKFAKAAEFNRARMGAKTAGIIASATKESVEKFSKDIASGEINRAVARMAKIRSTVTDSVRANDGANIQGIGREVVNETQQAMGEVGASLNRAAKTAEAAAKATTDGQMKHVSQKLAEAVESELKESFVDVTIDGFDITQKMAWRTDLNFLRRLGSHIGNKDLRPLYLDGYSYAAANAARYTAGLSDLTKKFKTDDLVAAFNKIKAGGIEGVDDPAIQALNPYVKRLFDPTHPEYDMIRRNGMLLSEVNKKFERFGLSDKFRFKKSTDEWTTWEIDDPLDFLAKAHTALANVAAHQTLGTTFGIEFGHKTYRKGLVKITNNGNRKSTLYNYIDADNLYFDKDIAEQMAVLDEFMTAMDKPLNRSKLLKTYDTALYVLKSGLTMYRVGHHTRNAMGDAWLSAMDGVVNPKYYTNAAHSLSVARGKYTDFNFQQALAGVGEMPDSTKIVARMKLGKEKIDISASEAYRSFFKHGGLKDHMMLDDLNYDSLIAGETGNKLLSKEGAVGRLQKPLGGHLRKAAVATSEVRDHYFRMAHYLHALENVKPRTHRANGVKMSREEIIDDMYRRAAERIQKHHPDGSDLTMFERSTMRRTITFYSWARKTLPLVVEHMFLNPGRFMAYPKFMYDMAEGMGIDLESYGDPFPSDQMFPSFLRDSVQGPVMGESGNYWALKTGMPGVDLIDAYLYSPKQTVEELLRGMSPLLRVPAELATGSKFGTQAPIMDYSDYIGQNIPNVQYADKISDKYFDRTVSSLFTDDLYQAKSNEDYDPSIDNRGFINWMTGIGLTDMSKPSYIKTAEREMGERMGR